MASSWTYAQDAVRAVSSYSGDLVDQSFNLFPSEEVVLFEPTLFDHELNLKWLRLFWVPAPYYEWYYVLLLAEAVHQDRCHHIFPDELVNEGVSALRAIRGLVSKYKTEEERP